MKYFYGLIIFILSSLTSFAQVTNTFPASGNVGVGTTAPGTSLEVAVNSVFTDLLRIKNTSSNYPYLSFYKGDTRTSYFGHGGNDSDIYLQSATGSIFFSPNDQISMALAGNGDVGIGTSFPAAKLEIRSGVGVTTLKAIGSNGYILINNVGSGESYYQASQAHRFQGSSHEEVLTILGTGNVGIGSINPRDKLSVNGKIRAHEIKVETASWPDYVFAKSYELPTLQETEKHIKEKGHLLGIPSAADVKANGIDLGEMNAKLLQKIEELTLYLIEQNNGQKALQEEVQILKKEIFNLKSKR